MQQPAQNALHISIEHRNRLSKPNAGDCRCRVSADSRQFAPCVRTFRKDSCSFAHNLFRCRVQIARPPVISQAAPFRQN